MTLKVYNTLTRTEEPFYSIIPYQVLMYYCGVTVYDYCHLGHARACIVWDVVRRYLEFIGYQVRFVQNFTDIDDKILNRAIAEGTTMEQISERFIKAYFDDMGRLNIKPADCYPRATHTIDGIKRLIFELEQKNFAYPSQGDVYYSVRRFPNYGKLSQRKLEDLQIGASGRMDQSETDPKQDPFDFALWKKAKPNEPSWDSPWGPGRPGWHIECSAMVREYLGETIDIHTGGADLIFPHHENEIAQSEAITQQPLARYWLHNGMVTVNGEKMSKSLGNFITIRELLDRPTDPMAIRMFVLMAHYRKPIDFTVEAINAAQQGWNTLKQALIAGIKYEWNQDQEMLDDYVERFTEAMNQDFNFSVGLSVLFELAKDLNKEANILVHNGVSQTDLLTIRQKWYTLVTLAATFGLEIDASNIDDSKSMDHSITESEIEELIEQRKQARQQKNYAQSDRIRDLLKAEGITLIDSPNGTKWHRN